MDDEKNLDHQPPSEPATDERPTAGARQDAGADVPSGEASLGSPPADRKSKKSRKQSPGQVKAVGKKNGKKAKDSFDDRQLDMFELFATLLPKVDGGDEPECFSICGGTGSSEAGEADDPTSSQVVATLGSNLTAQP